MLVRRRYQSFLMTIDPFLFLIIYDNNGPCHPVQGAGGQLGRVAATLPG